MAPIILEKRDLRNRNRNTAINKTSKKGTSVAAKKLEVLYQQDIGDDQSEADDEKDLSKSNTVQLNLRKSENIEADMEQLQDLADHFGTETFNDEMNGQDLENVVITQPISKKEKKWGKRYDELKKDFGALNERFEQMVKEWRAVKRILNRCGPQPDSGDEMEDENYDELPRFPLKKVKHVTLMYDNINDRTYKKQLIMKLRTIGGKTIKKNVINIFKLLFSSKLKTRFCWKGSTKKKAFEKFDRIVDVIRQAVKSRHKICKVEDIERECQLRFKQADKDFEREQLKQSAQRK